MSASREKKLRKVEKDLQALNKSQKSIESGKWQRNTAIAVSAIILAMVIFFVVLASGVIQRFTTAVTVGTEKISVAEYNFYLYSNVNSYINSMSGYGLDASSLGLDLDKPLDDQAYPYSSSGETWGSYFRNQTSTSLKQTLALYLEAKANGVSLPVETRPTSRTVSRV
jgi:hypothetical protein